MANPNNCLSSLVKDIKIIENAIFNKIKNFNSGRLLVYKCCEIDPAKWDAMCKRYKLDGWLAVPVDNVSNELLYKIILWEMERTKKNSLSLCVCVVKISEEGIWDVSSLSSYIKTIIHITDYVFTIDKYKVLILFTDTSLLKSKKSLLTVLSHLKSKLNDVAVSAGMVCYKGKERIEPEELVKIAENFQQRAQKKGELIEVGPVLGMEESKKIQVTVEEKRFLFSS